LSRREGARRELERARKKAEEELGREQLVRVADVIRRIRERQAGHVEEAKRIQTAAQQQKQWGRGLKASLSRLGENQAALADETRSVVRKDLNNAPVFAKLLERAS